MINVEPDDATAPTAPVDEFTVATEVVPLVQVPPLTALNNVPLPPGQRDVAPVIVPGTAVIVIVLLAAMPQPVENEIVAEPPAIPVMTPVAALTEATEVLDELHVPAPALFVQVVEVPWQIVVVPVNEPGIGLTVTVCTATGPQGAV